jgi:hypothetical protein
MLNMNEHRVIGNETDCVPFDPKNEELIIKINKKVNNLTARNADDTTIMMETFKLMDDVKNIIDSCPQEQLNIYTQKYKGFYRFMKILESLAAGLADGTISVP